MKTVCFLLFVLFGLGTATAQHQIDGFITHQNTGESLPFVNVNISSQAVGVSTDFQGYFKLENAKLPATLLITHLGFEQAEIAINQDTDFPIRIQLKPQNINLQEVSILADIAQERYNPLSFNKIDAEKISTQLGDKPFPAIMDRIPGVFASRDGGGSGDASLSIRGFKQENIAVLLNGVPINGAENGLIYWNNWLGLTEATAGIQVQRGIGASKVALNSVGGTVNILTNLAYPKKAGFLSVSTTSYGNQKLTFAYQTGRMENGWSISLLGSRLKGEGYIDATYVDAWAYFISAAREIGKNQRIVLSLLGGPERHGQRNLKLSEQDISLHGTKFNKDWGSYNGQIKNASENFYHKPHFSINHYWDISDKVLLSSAAYLSPGWGGGKWSDSFNYGPGVFDFRNPSGQIDWESIYNYNAQNTDSYTLANGETVTGYSKLVQTNFLASHMWGGVMSSAEINLTQNQKITAGLHYRYFQSSLTQRVDDLLGGNFYLDDFSWSAAGVAGREQVRLPGDLIRINNGALLHQSSLFAQWEYKTGAFTFFAGGTLSENQYKRHDSYNYPNNKWSEWVGISGFDIKGGLNFNLDEKQHFYFNAGHFSKAPYYKFVFGNFSNTPVKDPKNEKVSSIETGYGFRNEQFSVNINGYYTLWEDVSFLSNEYVQLENDQQSRAMVKGLNALHRGIELEANTKISRNFKAGFFITSGDWKWKNDVQATLFNHLDVAVDTVSVFANGLKVGGQPQFQTAVFADFILLDFFNLAINATYSDQHYADFDPSGRQDETDRNQSYRIPPSTLINMHLSFNYPLNKQLVTLYVNCNNLLDDTYIIKGEDGTQHNLEDFRGFWSFGRTFDMGIRYRF
ncbi:MAG: TonB-dependent receptor [Bacteroidetes bacterium]|jgi:iron complex outermembrane receptor protein|nr:TonB-dependent receptor [Bacteroidota bacterium]